MTVFHNLSYFFGFDKRFPLLVMRIGLIALLFALICLPGFFPKEECLLTSFISIIPADPLKSTVYWMKLPGSRRNCRGKFLHDPSDGHFLCPCENGGQTHLSVQIFSISRQFVMQVCPVLIWWNPCAGISVLLKNDNFIFFLDTYGDETNGFTFGTNAAGAQWDGTMYEGGKVDLSWDNIWYSKVKARSWWLCD